MSIQREIIFKADDSQFSSIVDRVGKTITEAFSSAGDEVEKTNKRMSDLSGSIKTEMDKIQNSGKSAFAELLRGSEKYGNNIKERLGYLQRELQIQQQLLREETARQQLAAKLRYEAERQTLADNGAGKQQFSDLDDQYSEERTNIDADAKVKELKLRSAQNEYSTYRANELERKSDEDNENKRKRGNGVGGAVAGGFTAAMGAIGLGALFSLGGFVAKTIGEAEEQSRARTRIQGLTQGGGSLGINGMYDLKKADAMRYDETLATTSGSARNLAKRGFEQYSFEKAFSLDPGTLNQGAVALRMSGAHRSSADVALEMLNFFKQSKVFGIEKGDFSRVSELLSINNDLNAQQVEQSGRVDPMQTAKMMAMFGKFGIDSSRIGSYENGINAGIRNPTDEFSGAVIMRALSKAHPEMSLFQLQEQQAKGAFGGNISAVMKEFGNTASGELLIKTLQSAFKLEPQQARTLVEGYQKNNRIFDGPDGDKVLRKMIKSSDVTSRAENNTTTIQTLLREFNDKFAEIGLKEIAQIQRIIDLYEALHKPDTTKPVTFRNFTGQNAVSDEVDSLREKAGLGNPVNNFFRKLFPDVQSRKTDADINRKAFNDHLKEVYGSPDAYSAASYVPNFEVGRLKIGMKPGGAQYNRIPISYLNEYTGKNDDKKSFQLNLGNAENLNNLGIKNGEMEKILNTIANNRDYYDKKDGKIDGDVPLSVLKDILIEIRKSNNTTQHRKNSVPVKTK